MEEVEADECGGGGGWRRVGCGVKVSERVDWMLMRSEQRREEEAEQCWAGMVSSSGWSQSGLDQAHETG